MNDITINHQNIEDLIYEIDGKQVMIDSDLAKLYHVETKRINEAVKKNPEKFPDRYLRRISDDKYNFLKSKKTTSKGGSRKGHTVFTEQGVAMLATILRSKVAVEVSIQIMDAFVAMRHYIGNSLIEQKYINNLVLEDHDKLSLLEQAFNQLEEKRKITDIYYDGQIFDAYSKIYEIFSQAKNQLIIIDSYADCTLLDIIKRLNVQVTIITHNNHLLTKQDIDRYNQQYHNLKVVYDQSFHDRYFILDDNEFYHCGASVNRIGYKTFSITLMSDKDICEMLLNRLHSFY